MKKFVTILCAIVMAAGLAACTENEDNNDGMPVVNPGQELVSQISGTRIDVSLFPLTGVVFLWDLREDCSMTCYTLMKEGDEILVDTLTGTWKPRLEAENRWDASYSGKLYGFTVDFDIPDLDVDQETPTAAYVLLDNNDGDPVVVSEFILDHADLIFSASMARGMTRGFLDNVGNFFRKAANAVVDALKTAGKTVAKFVGLDLTNQMLSADECKQFYELVDKTLSDFSSQVQSSTDYAEWMGDIFKDKNPLISEMNLPGTHDTFTYQIINQTGGSAIAAYGLAQSLDIEGQWDAGVRVFDVRLRSTNGNLTVPDDLFNKEVVGIFHGSFYCFINFDEAIGRIASLLRRHPSEMCIVMLKMESDGDINNGFVKKVHDIVAEHDDCLVHNPNGSIRYNDCKGKMLIIQRWESKAPQDPDHSLQLGPVMIIDSDASIASNSYTTNIHWPDGSSQKAYVQDLYRPGTSQLCGEYWEQKKDYMQTYFDYAKSNTSDWVFNYESGYVGMTTMSYSKSANVMNPWVTQYILKNMDQHYGIIPMDFAGSNEKFDGYYPNGKYLPMVLVESNRFR